MSKLILTNEVSGLGSAGDVVDVKNGYARNYLIPQGFAVAWSRGGEKQVEQIRAARTARALATLEEAQALKSKLESGKVKLSVKVGRDGRLFGSVKTDHIATAVAAAGLGDEAHRARAGPSDEGFQVQATLLRYCVAGKRGSGGGAGGDAGQRKPRPI
jgi:large subunit ribosomal protein L9